MDAFFVQCGCSVPEDAHSACHHPCLVHPRRDLCIISPFPYIPNFLIGGLVVRLTMTIDDGLKKLEVSAIGVPARLVSCVWCDSK